MNSSSPYLWVISQEVLMISISKMTLNITPLKFQPHLPGATEWSASKPANVASVSPPFPAGYMFINALFIWSWASISHILCDVLMLFLLIRPMQFHPCIPLFSAYRTSLYVEGSCTCASMNRQLQPGMWSWRVPHDDTDNCYIETEMSHSQYCITVFQITGNLIFC